MMYLIVILLFIIFLSLINRDTFSNAESESLLDLESPLESLSEYLTRPNFHSQACPSIPEERQINNYVYNDKLEEQEEELLMPDPKITQRKYEEKLYNDLPKCLTDSYKNLASLHENLKNNLEIVNDNRDSLIKNTKKLNQNMNIFENLNYNKALITAAKIQGYEDIFLHKLNEKINY